MLTSKLRSLAIAVNSCYNCKNKQMKNFSACLSLLTQPDKTIGVFFNTDEKSIQYTFKTAVQKLPAPLLVQYRSLSIVNPLTRSSVHFINVSTENKLMRLQGMQFTDSFSEGLLFSDRLLKTVESRVRPFSSFMPL